MSLIKPIPRFPAYATFTDKLGWWALRGLCVAVLIYLLLPILVMVPLSFSASSFLVYPVPGWSTQWYANLLTSEEWVRAAKNSFIVAPAACLIATCLGTLTAVGLARIQFPGKGLLMSVLIAPMVVPIVVVGVACYLFFARKTEQVSAVDLSQLGLDVYPGRVCLLRCHEGVCTSWLVR
jgi:putative spermidine/putrescine transport system permease protein